MTISKQRLVAQLLEVIKRSTLNQPALSFDALEVAKEYAIGRIMEGKVRDVQEAVNVWAACADGFSSMRKAKPDA